MLYRYALLIGSMGRNTNSPLRMTLERGWHPLQLHHNMGLIKIVSTKVMSDSQAAPSKPSKGSSTLWQPFESQPSPSPPLKQGTLSYIPGGDPTGHLL
jgi:hypothetical protein